MSIKIQDILNKINFLDFHGNSDHEVKIPVELNTENEDPNVLMWVSLKNIKLLENVKTGILIVPLEFNDVVFNKDCDFIVVENPRRMFMEILNKFFVQEKPASISESSNIDDSVIIGKNVSFGINVVIERNCKIGDNTSIDHNSVIKENTIIGDCVVIGCNNTIGGAGYGYEKNENGEFEFIPHLGNVIIGDKVEIGNNTCIDRAVLGSTILADNVKVDNQVHIAHGVKIGKNSMVIANSMIAGSVKIGVNAWIAPSASILNQKTIGDNSLIGMGAVVLKDVPNDKIYIGNPARDLKQRL